MLKIRNLIFALSFTPLMSLAWQLPSLAQVSVGTAGTPSGAQTSGTTITIFSAPPSAITPITTTTATTTTGSAVIIPIIPGVPEVVTSGVSTTGATSAATTTTGGDTNATVAVTAASVETTSSSVTVTDSATGKLDIFLAPPAQVVVNQLAAAIVQNVSGTTGGTTGGSTDGVGALLTDSAGSQQSAAALTSSFTAAGISPQLATALVTSLTGLFSSPSASLPNQPVALAKSGQLVASTKAFKPVTIIAQGSAGISVNINKLNDAIVSYNAIILQSEAKAVKNLSNNTGFRGIGGILKQLRTAIK